MSLPKELSPGEELLAQHLTIYKIPFEREAVLVEGRKWKTDFVIETHMLAIEVEGGTEWGKSRHSRGRGFENDARKYNAIALKGYRVLRFTTAMVLAGEAIDTIRAAIGGEKL